VAFTILGLVATWCFLPPRSAVPNLVPAGIFLPVKASRNARQENKLKFKNVINLQKGGKLSYKYEKGKGKNKFLGSGILYISSCLEAL
jgi:hypothetical protein